MNPNQLADLIWGGEADEIWAMLEQGWTDDQIVDEFVRREPGSLIVRVGGAVGHARPMTQWRLDAVRELLAEKRGAAPQPMTTAAQTYIPKILACWREMVKDGIKPSRVKIADQLGIDRGTIRTWELKGWLRLPPVG